MNQNFLSNLYASDINFHYPVHVLPLSLKQVFINIFYFTSEFLFVFCFLHMYNGWDLSIKYLSDILASASISALLFFIKQIKNIYFF